MMFLQILNLIIYCRQRKSFYNSCNTHPHNFIFNFSGDRYYWFFCDIHNVFVLKLLNSKNSI